MAVLRPVIRTQALSHNTYLILFRISYTLAMVLWIFALLIMLLRFLLAIDFQLVDIETNYDRELREGKFKEQEFVEVLLNSPQSPKMLNTLQVKNDRTKSEDDFQSAKSHMSEVSTPLLEPLTDEIARNGVLKA